MPRNNKPADLPILERVGAAIVVGYDLDVMVRQRYCEWCLFWDFNQALETDTFPESARLVLINAALGSSGEDLKSVFEQKGLKIRVQTVSSGVTVIQSLLEKIFEPNIRMGKRGPLMRRVIESEPKVELEPMEEIERTPTRPAPIIENPAPKPIRVKDNPVARHVKKVANLSPIESGTLTYKEWHKSKDKAAPDDTKKLADPSPNESMASTNEEWLERLKDALTAQKNVKKTPDQDK